MYFSSLGASPCGSYGGQQFAPQVAGEIDSLSAVTKRRAERVGRLRLGHAGQHRGVSDGAVVFLAPGDRPALDGVGDGAHRHADGRDERIARLHRDRELLNQRRVEPVPDAAVVRDSHRRGRIEHEAVADAVLFRLLLIHVVELGGGDLGAVERLGGDLGDRHRSDNVEVAVDELSDAGRLVERPGHAVLRDAALQGKIIEFGRSRRVILRVNDRRLLLAPTRSRQAQDCRCRETER